jgi:polyisoprenoid-binding protein YceI
MQTQTGITYSIDPAHTTVEFVVRHLMISKVRGRFSKIAGTIVVPEGSDVPASIQATIDVPSIDTREPDRDTHLRSADFFDAEHNPQITFASTAIGGSAGALRVTGDLTIRGNTRSVVLDAEFEGRAVDPWGNNRIAYTAQTKINRSDFGLAWNQALEAGGVVVSDEVRIELNVQAIEQK